MTLAAGTDIADLEAHVMRGTVATTSRERG
jgi:hypothetical protein